MKEFPLISVLVPAYNHERFVAKTLDSILDDNYPNKELVIVNDGSLDNTGRIIEQWLEKYPDEISVKYITQANGGVTKTLNTLVDLSRGEYLLFIHSDDYLLQEGIRKRYEYLKENPGKLAVFSDCIVVDENDNIVHDSGLEELHNANKANYHTEKSLRKEIIMRWSVPGGTIMVKKSAFEQFRYNENFIIEDLDFYLYFSSKSMIGFLDEKVSAYRVHGLNTCMVNENWIRVQKDLIQSLKNNFRYFSLEYKMLIIAKMIVLSKPLVAHKLTRLFTGNRVSG